MTIDTIKINERLEKLKQYAGFLQKFQEYSFERFSADQMVRSAVERQLQLAIGCVIDISEILISNLGLRKPEVAKEVFQVIGEAGLIPTEFVKRLVAMAGFCNILVHEYLDLDMRKVYDHLQNDLGDFDKFAQLIADYLTKTK